MFSLFQLIYLVFAWPIAGQATNQLFEECVVSPLLDYRDEGESWIQSYFNRSASHPLQSFNKNFENRLEKWLENLMGKGLFQISGYQSHPSDFGIYGDGEVHNKVRITFINGMLTFPENQLFNLELIASTHLRTNIHYITRATAGWTKDMIGCILSRLGVVSEQAVMLAERWRTLIDDMGGINGGGVVIHYAHSIGGSETAIAKNLLSLEEQEMIRVYTIGSPFLIPVGGFQQVVNYVSRRDGVCLLDPIGFIQGLIDPKCNIVYTDTFIGTPLIDHPLSSPSYQGIMRELGQKFAEEFGKK